MKDSRTCKSCGITQDKELFPVANTRGENIWYRHHCKPCYYKKQGRNRLRNRKWLHNFKQNLECEKCGYSKKTHPESFRVQALQFHHHEENKRLAVSDLTHRGFALETIREEINKCVVLCSRCHIEEHYPNKESF